MKSLKNSRQVIVRSVQVVHTKAGDPMHPCIIDPDFPSQVNEADELWTVWIEAQEGSKTIDAHYSPFLSKDEATAFAEQNAVGSEFSWEVSSGFQKDQDLITLAIEKAFIPVYSGDQLLGLPWKVLQQSGMFSEDNHNIADSVIGFLGKQRVSTLKEIYGENWECAAQLEYCWRNYPTTSAAFLAAVCRFRLFVLQEEFSAGYLLRDLEILVDGAEAEAAKAQETRQKAGGAGGKTSSKARETRRSCILNKIEALAERNPDIVRFGVAALAKIALSDCEKENPSLWKQGRGQIADYLGEIRRGEAGPVMQKRYQAIFGSKPPKRFGDNG